MQSTVYDQEYFSGTQACLYIGDVLIDEISSFNFMINQAKTPIYGYADQLFAAVAAGPVIVSGSFTINFKEANYLYLALMRYQMFTQKVSDAISKFSTSIGGGGAVDSLSRDLRNVPTPFIPVDGKTAVLRQTIEAIITGNVSEQQKYNFYQDLSGYSKSAGFNSDFKDIQLALESSIWGGEASSIDKDKEVRRTDDNFFDGFDMYLTYGDYNNQDASKTVERITGVHLTSRGKAVSVSGEPIQEQYQFIARNSF